MDIHFRLPLLVRQVPPCLRRSFTIKAAAGLQESMTRRGSSLQRYELMAFNGLVWASLFLVPLALALASLPFPYSILSAAALALLFAIPAWVLSMPSRIYDMEQRSFLLDSPSVVGAMTMSMNRSPSLERALEAGCRSGSGPLHSSLSMVSWRSLTGEAGDLRESISAWSSCLDRRNEGLRRSLHLILAAEEAPQSDGRYRLLERANSLVMEGLREAFERYVGSLSFPVMLVFAFGVLAPVMLFSLIPMMGMQGGEMDLTTLALLLLVVVPSMTLAYTRSMVSRSPLRVRNDHAPREGWRQLLLLSAVPAFAAAYLVTSSALWSTMAALALALIALFEREGERGNEEEDAASFVDGLYRMGNAMLGGKDLEAAFQEAARAEEGRFRSWASRMTHLTRTGRSQLAEVVRDDWELTAMGEVLRQSYLTVMECSRDDHVGAGRVAVNLAQCQSDMFRTRRKMRESLRSVVDMMSSTSLVFAPVVIGLTSGIMGMLGGDRDWLMALASVYVVELAFLVNYFTGSLDGWKRGNGKLTSYGARGALALAVFLTASLCGQSLLFRLF